MPKNSVFMTHRLKEQLFAIKLGFQATNQSIVRHAYILEWDNI